jgi:hypothetical protein
VPDFATNDDVVRWLHGRPREVAAIFALRAVLRIKRRLCGFLAWVEAR